MFVSEINDISVSRYTKCVYEMKNFCIRNLNEMSISRYKNCPETPFKTCFKMLSLERLTTTGTCTFVLLKIENIFIYTKILKYKLFV